MRNLTHGIYLLAIVAAIAGTYILASSGSPSAGLQSENHSPGIPPEQNVVSDDTAPQPRQDTTTAAMHQDSNPELDQAQARIDELEAEVAEYQQLKDRLNDLSSPLSPERAEAQRAEGRDHEWATANELDLETLFIRDERLRDIQIEQLNCYSEHCELTLNHPGLADGFPSQYFSSLLNDEERFQNENFTFMTVGDSESTQLILNKGEPADD